MMVLKSKFSNLLKIAIQQKKNRKKIIIAFNDKIMENQISFKHYCNHGRDNVIRFIVSQNYCLQ